MTKPPPKITFGIIVLNGEPFTRYCLRSLYPFAHQIIVCEGASPAARHIAGDDGHSTDGTLKVLRRFKKEEDPDNKLTIITAEDKGYSDGFWPGEKHEQSQAYAERATGDFLWQVDIDEFYKAEDMHTVFALLAKSPSPDAVSFDTMTFWGDFNICVDGTYLRKGSGIYHRLFKWEPDYHYSTHRPPTVRNNKGQNLRRLHWVDGHKLRKRGVVMYHYSLLFPRQVRDKCAYYQNASFSPLNSAQRWAEEAYFSLRRPFRVHNVYNRLSWLERFRGEHPAQIQALQADIENGLFDIERRPMNDVEHLLKSRWYRVARSALKSLNPFYRHIIYPLRRRKMDWEQELKYALKNPTRFIRSRSECQ